VHCIQIPAGFYADALGLGEIASIVREDDDGLEAVHPAGVRQSVGEMLQKPEVFLLRK